MIYKVAYLKADKLNTDEIFASSLQALEAYIARRSFVTVNIKPASKQ